MAPEQEPMISRRRFAGAALAAGVGLVAADQPARAARLGTRAASKTVAVVLNGQAPWAPYLEVGAQDAANQVGWKLKRIVGTNGNSEAMQVNLILQALSSGVDVILTPDWYQGETVALKQVKAKGKTVVVVNAEAFPPQMEKLGFAFVGQEQASSGGIVAAKLLTLVKQKRGNRVVLAGNPFPGPGPIQQRIDSMSAYFETYNRQHGTKFKVVSFNDNGTSPAQSVSLYQAEFAKIGSDLAAIAVPGGQVSLAPLLTALKSGSHPAGRVPIGSWDTEAAQLSALQNGSVSFLVDQGFYYQGYFGVQVAWTAIERKAPPIDINTGGDLVTRANLAAYKAYNAVVLAKAKSYGFV